jgi:hypothetical protein
MPAVRCVVVLFVVAAMFTPRPAVANEQAVRELLTQLNALPMVAITERSRSYEILFDALLDLTEPPMPVGARFNLNFIHPGMRNWNEVRNWAESNPHLAEAILETETRRTIEIGLPYGRDNVKEAYRHAGLYADIGSDGSLHTIRFPYLDGFNRIAAFATAEIYGRFEDGQVEEALELSMATILVLRQLCNREFHDEKMHAILLLTDMLANLRDMFYMYRDRISAEQYRQFAVTEIPFLRPDRSRLLMPEGDRMVAEAILKQVFDNRGIADPYEFPRTFAVLQARAEPLTRFGAYRRWQMIAGVHDSLEASLERLQLVYDDWWRRWRVQEYDPILAVPTEFSLLNPIRHAAVVHTVRDIQFLFDARKELMLAVNGTAMAAGLCSYYRTHGTYPRDQHRLYAAHVRKASDVDPYDQSFGHLLYLFVDSRREIDTPHGRIWVEPGNGIIYSRGQNYADNRARLHTDDGSQGDIVIWPPPKALMREQGVLY